ncbi:MAG: hypothetical protein HZA95_01995 [Candidatus Vogelbacteria bacterium]|nr:hypothetical protein [Candidatus Vogelbacteria bacterium]
MLTVSIIRDCLLIILIFVSVILMAQPGVAVAHFNYGTMLEARWEPPLPTAITKSVKVLADKSYEGHTARITFPDPTPIAGLPRHLECLGVMFLALSVCLVLNCKDLLDDDKPKALLFLVWLIGVEAFCFFLSAHVVEGSFRRLHTDDQYEAQIVSGKLLVLVKEKAREEATENVNQELLADFLLDDFYGLIIGIVLRMFVACVREETERRIQFFLRAGENETSLKLGPGGTLEESVNEYTFHMLPLPSFRPAKKILGKIPWKLVAQVLTNALNSQDLYDICRQVRNSFKKLFRRMIELAAKNADSNLREQIQSRAVYEEELKSRLTGDRTFGNALLVLREASNTVINRFQADLNSKIQTDARTRLHGLVMSLDQKLERLEKLESQDGTGLPDGSPLPEGTRFCRRRGQGSVLVIEHKPQIRSVMFRKGFMLRPWDDRGPILTEDTTLRLAFPYTIFFVCCTDSGVQSLHVYYRTQPLGRVTDALLKPNLPNIRDGGDVCMTLTPIPDSTMSQRILDAIGVFWQSQFNNDLRGRYSDRSVNPIGDIREWEKRSIVEPEFTLGINWQTLDQSVLQKTDSILSAFPKPALSEVRKQLGREIEDMAKNFTKVFIEICQTVPSVTAYDKALEKVLQNHLVTLANELPSMVVSNILTQVDQIQDMTKRELEKHLEREVRTILVSELILALGQALVGANGFPGQLHRVLQDARRVT